LTTYSACKSRINAIGTQIVDADHQAEVERLINVVSGGIERYCERPFRKEARTERHAPPSGYVLCLDAFPVSATPAPTATIDGVAATVAIEDSERGMLRCDEGWGAGDYEDSMSGSVSLDTRPDTAERCALVTYTGGYVLPGDASAAVVEGAVASAATGRFTLTAPAHPVDSGALVVSVVTSATNIAVSATWDGESILSDTFAASAAPKTYALGVADVPNGVSACADLVGFSLLVESAAATATEVTYTISDAADAAAAVVRDLPWEIEEAAIVSVAMLWKQRLGGYSADVLPDRNSAIDRGMAGILPDVVLPMLAPYRRWD
jgi:hypothetical protein